MRYCRFSLNGAGHYGLVESIAGSDFITRTFLQSPAASDGDLEGLPSRRTEKIAHVALDEARLLAPVAPSKIICVGRNYSEHAKELGNEVPSKPLIFSKPPSAVIATGRSGAAPEGFGARRSRRRIGRRHRPPLPQAGDDEDVRPYILGYTCVNDVTARDLQNKDDQWTRAKGFDTFCPVGPVVVDGLDPWSGVKVETRVNGEVRQHGTTRDFIFPLDVHPSYAQVMTLLPGDLIATGTSGRRGSGNAGDVVEISIPGIGVLRNPVADEG